VGYSFGAVQTTHKIVTPAAAVTKAGLTGVSCAVRFKIDAANATFRTLVRYIDSGEAQLNFGIRFNTSGTNNVAVQFTGNTAGLSWTTGFGAGSTHTLVATYDAANLRLYADTDATAKVTQAETGTPSTSGTQHFCMGNGHTSSASLAGTLYEVAWWIGTVLTGTQAAQFGAGFTADTLRPLPNNHWMLLDNVSGTTIDRIGGVAGTVNSASLVAHTPIYPPTGPMPFVGAVSTFTVGTGIRRTLSELGTRMGSRQAQEA
jgi:hypothetical protein